MKKILFMSIIAVSILMTGCQALNFDSRMMEVHEGMPQSRVRDLLGKPSQRSFDKRTEVWEYIMPYSEVENKICIVRFNKDKRVTSMDTFIRTKGIDAHHRPHKPHHHRETPRR